MEWIVYSRLINYENETGVVSPSFNISVFVVKYTVASACVQTGVMSFSAWYSTLWLLMSSYFSQALVAQLLFSPDQNGGKYRPPVGFKSLFSLEHRGSALLFSPS